VIPWWAWVAAYLAPIVPIWRRALWSESQDKSESAAFDAFMVAAFWPLVGALLVCLSPVFFAGWVSERDGFALPPRKVRRQERIKALEARNAELERRLGL
jgi:hypothetical protein